MRRAQIIAKALRLKNKLAFTDRQSLHEIQTTLLVVGDELLTLSNRAYEEDHRQLAQQVKNDARAT